MANEPLITRRIDPRYIVGFILLSMGTTCWFGGYVDNLEAFVSWAMVIFPWFLPKRHLWIGMLAWAGVFGWWAIHPWKGGMPLNAFLLGGALCMAFAAGLSFKSSR